MDFTKKKILKDFNKLYNFQIAEYKQKNKSHTFKNEQEMFNILAYYNLSVLVYDAINQYKQQMDHENPIIVLSCINLLLFKISVDIIKEVDKIDKKQAELLLKKCFTLLQNVRKE